MFPWPGDNASSRGKEPSRQWIGASRLLAVGWRVWAGPLVLLVFIVLAGWLALSRHATFHTHVFDLGYYAQVIWNTGHGRWFATSLKPPTFLGDHFSPLLAILAPLFWITTDASVLLIVEIIALSMAIIPGYLILRQRHVVLAPLLVLGFVLNPALHTLALQEFHEIMLAIPLLSLAMYALYLRKMPLFYVALALTLLVREDMAIICGSVRCIHVALCGWSIDGKGS